MSIIATWSARLICPVNGVLICGIAVVWAVLLGGVHG
jgi:hypothetical protein